MNRFRRLVAGVAAGALALAATPAFAQDDAPVFAFFTLEPVVGADDDIVANLTIDPSPDTIVTTVIGDAVESVDELDTALAGGPIDSVVYRSDPVTVGFVNLDGDSLLGFRLPTPAAVDRVGVWPMRIEFSDPGGTVLATLTAPILRRPDEGATPVLAPVAVIRARPTTRTAAGEPIAPDTVDMVAEAVEGVDARPELPWTIAVSGETVTALRSASTIDTSAGLVFGELKRLAGLHTLATMPYLDVDLGGIDHADLGVIVPALARQGRDSLAGGLGVEPDVSLWPVSPDDHDGMHLLDEDVRVDAVIVDVDDVGSRVPVDLDVGPVGLPVTTLTPPTFPDTDRGPTAAFAAAARFWLEQRPPAPGFAASFESPDPETDALDAVLDVTADWGTLAVGDVGDLLAAGSRSTAVFPSADSDDLSGVSQRLPPLTGRLFGVVPMVGDDSPRFDDVARSVALAVADGLPDGERQAALDEIDGFVDRVEGAISFGGNRTINLTSRTGTVPVTVRNGIDIPVTVEITVASDRISFPNGATRSVTVPAEDQVRVDIDARALASGSVPVFVSVAVPEGGAVIASSQLNVRSTAISGVGLLLSIGALSVLGLWWLRTWRNGRVAARLPLEPSVSDPPHPPEPTS